MTHVKVLIIGSGPAGLTAAIYASRANLAPLVLEGLEPGGQLTTTTDVENFPGFPEGIMGPELIDKMLEQAKRFGSDCRFETVESVDFKTKPFTVVSDSATYTADTVIMATGASAKYIGLPNELAMIGHGVSACATCDGFFFRDKKVAVVGGGDSAMEEANFLTRFASKVVLIHRRDAFRASKIMQDRTLNNPKVEVVWHAVVDDVVGTKDTGVTALKIRNVQTDEVTEQPFDGLFLAIGHKPNTDIVQGMLNLDKTGYILVESGSTRTNIPGVFACGDVADHVYRQAITSAGFGCMAALDAEKYLDDVV
jgi:thioredoxin reductase (NADPH)